MLEKLNPRERLFVFGGGGLLVVMLIVFAGVQISKKRAGIEEDVVRAREDVAKITKLRDDINSLPSPQSLPDMNAFIATTTSLLEKYNLKPQDIRERPDTSSRTEELLVLEISLNAVALKDVISFLHDVEYGRQVNAIVGGLVFRKSLPGREVYDTKITLVIHKPKVRIQ